MGAGAVARQQYEGGNKSAKERAFVLLLVLYCTEILLPFEMGAEWTHPHSEAPCEVRPQLSSLSLLRKAVLCLSVLLYRGEFKRVLKCFAEVGARRAQIGSRGGYHVHGIQREVSFKKP